MLKKSLSTRVTISLSILLLIMSLFAIITAVIFYKISTSVINVARHDIPLLTRTFNLVLDSERMTSVAPDIIVAQNSFIREALSREFTQKNRSWEDGLTSMQQSHSQLPQLQKVAELSRDLHLNIQKISAVIDERMEIELKINQISRRIRRLGETINSSSQFKSANELSTKIHEEISQSINRTIILLLSTPPAQSESAIHTIEHKYRISVRYTDELLAQFESGNFQDLMEIHQELVRFSQNEHDIFTLTKERLGCIKNLENMLVSNTFVSNQIDHTTDLALSHLSANIDNIIETITNQLKFANIISIILPVLGVVCAIFILFHLRTLVVGRLLSLQKAIRSHIHGDKVTIPVTGNDEITSMAEATRFFISEINKRENALLESHDKLEQRVKDRTMEINRQNDLLLSEIEERIAIEQALRDSEERFRLLAENLKDALCLVEMESGMMSFSNRAYTQILELGDRQQVKYAAELIDYIHPEDRQGIKDTLQQFWGKDSLENKSFEFRLLLDEGRIKWIFCRVVYIRAKNGTTIRAAIMAEDITRRMQVSKLVKESESRLKYLSTKLIESQEEERRRLATELHDNIGPSLAAVKFGVENAMNQQNDPNQQTEILQATVSMVKNVVQNISRIQIELRPSIIDDLGIIDAIDWYCMKYTKIYRHITIHKNMYTSKSLIPSALKIVVYRIIQESFNNIAKHSGATNIHLLLESEINTFKLKVEDDGCGIPFDILYNLDKPGSNVKTQHPGGGLGLVSMRERVELTAGKFSLESTDKGTSITCLWDCDVVNGLAETTQADN